MIEIWNPMITQPRLPATKRNASFRRKDIISPGAEKIAAQSSGVFSSGGATFNLPHSVPAVASSKRARKRASFETMSC